MKQLIVLFMSICAIFIFIMATSLVYLYQGKAANNFINENEFANIDELRDYLSRNFIIGNSSRAEVIGFLDYHEIEYEITVRDPRSGLPPSLILIRFDVTNPEFYGVENIFAQMINTIWYRFISATPPEVAVNYGFRDEMLEEIEIELRRK